MTTKHGLVLPNGRNATGMSANDIEVAKLGTQKRLALFKKNNIEFEKMLDTWKQSGHNHELGKALVLKIRGEGD